MRRFLFLGLILLALPLQGTTLLRYDLEGLTARAERVFVGTCQRASTELVNGRIYTRFFFTVKEMVKGEPAEQIELVLPGGQYQGVRSRIAGMPAFTPGEEVVLFLTEKNQLGHVWPVGLAQGKFRIERPGAAKRARVFQELDGLSFYHPSAAAKRVSSESPVNGLPLEEFLARVRALAAQEGTEDVR